VASAIASLGLAAGDDMDFLTRSLRLASLPASLAKLRPRRLPARSAFPSSSVGSLTHARRQFAADLSSTSRNQKRRRNPKEGKEKNLKPDVLSFVRYIAQKIGPGVVSFFVTSAKNVARTKFSDS
jgi:hypothetical protein